VVRMTLTPAVMTLLGRTAWYLPRWLDRVLPNVDIEGERLLAKLAAADPQHEDAGYGVHSYDVVDVDGSTTEPATESDSQQDGQQVRAMSGNGQAGGGGRHRPRR